MPRFTEEDFERLRKKALQKKREAELATGRPFKGGKVKIHYRTFGLLLLHIDQDGILHKLELPDGCQVDAS